MLLQGCAIWRDGKTPVEAARKAARGVSAPLLAGRQKLGLRGPVVGWHSVGRPNCRSAFIFCGFDGQIDDGLTDKWIFDADKGSIQAQALVEHRLIVAARSEMQGPPLGAERSIDAVSHAHHVVQRPFP